MRLLLKILPIASLALLATAAPAMTLQSASVGQSRGVAVADPDAHWDALAAASNPTDGGHGKMKKSVRNVLKDDKYLRSAFAWLDNQ